MKSLFKSLLILPIIFAVSASSFAGGGKGKGKGKEGDPSPSGNLIQTLTANGSFNTFLSLLQTAGLEGSLETSNDMTIFAPTDAAFAQLSPAQINALESNPSQLMAVLQYHIVQGEILTSSLNKTTNQTEISTGGENLNIVYNNNTSEFMVNNANIVIPDVIASNGVIQGIDTVLMPAAMPNSTPSPTATPVPTPTTPVPSATPVPTPMATPFPSATPVSFPSPAPAI